MLLKISRPAEVRHTIDSFIRDFNGREFMEVIFESSKKKLVKLKEFPKTQGDRTGVFRRKTLAN